MFLRKKEELLRTIKDLDDKESAGTNGAKKNEAKQDFQETAIREEISDAKFLELIGWEMVTTLNSFIPMQTAEDPITRFAPYLLMDPSVLIYNL